jgi:AcrR family transcriptional regulator
VYHYFPSTDEVLDPLFVERWATFLDVIRDVDAQALPARAKLETIAAFVVDSYRRDPDLMKVIVVEVTRAANSFGRAHVAEITEAYTLIGAVVAKGQAVGELRPEVSPAFAAVAFYGTLEQVITGWIFGSLAQGPEAFAEATQMVVDTICSGLER